MPATSEKQKRFMDAAAHNPAFAKKAGVPVSVAKDFSEKSKGVKFGGPKTRPDLQKVNEPKTRQGKTELFSKGGDMKESKAMVKKEIGFMKKAGAPKSMIKHEKAEAGMKKGGMPMVMKDGKKIPAFAAKNGGMTKMAPGGMARTITTGNMAKTVMPGSRGTPTPVGSGFKSAVLPQRNGNMAKTVMPGSRGTPTPVGSGFKSAVLPQRNDSMQRLPIGGAKPMAKGGGIESKGKTQGTMIKMKSGGKAC